MSSRKPVPRVSRRRWRSGRLAPGLTILEVMLSVVILGLVAAAITSTIAAGETLNGRARQMTAAYEMAHRLVLFWLDDDRRMPAETLPLEYGPYQFMWDKKETNFRMSINDAQRRNSGGSTPQALSRFKLVTVNVYMAEGDPRQPYKGPLLATLSRMYDPAAPRNPDSMKTITNPDKLAKLIGDLTGQGSAGDTAEGAPRTRNRSRGGKGSLR